MDAVVSAKWLHNALEHQQGAISVLDASWYLPSMNRNGREDFDKEHIKTAQFFDIDEICDTTSDDPHMLPCAEVFSQKVSALGVSNDKKVIVYDGAGLFSAARVWWMFRVMGHDNVAVLDGGLLAWKAEGFTLTNQTDGLVTELLTPFKAEIRRHMVADTDAILATLDDKNHLLIDARPQNRFKGLAPEPRKGVRCGHIPGAVNLPFDALLTFDNRLKTSEELSLIFQTLGIGKRRVTTMCGSGVTAAIVSLALEIAGYTQTNLYDGSWSQWGAQRELPMESSSQNE